MIDADTEGEGKAWISHGAWVRGLLMELFTQLGDKVEKQVWRGQNM